VQATRSRPALVVIGANDPTTTPEGGRAIHAATPGAATTVLEAAHISNVEQPEAITQAVERFLEPAPA
jgi:3-oxoadipate enol-lactonase